MALDQQTLDVFVRHLTEKWKGSCVMCGERRWEVSGWIQLGLQNDPKLIGDNATHVLPCAAAVCVNCGNTVLVNAVAAGIFEKTPASEGNAAKTVTFHKEATAR